MLAFWFSVIIRVVVGVACALLPSRHEKAPTSPDHNESRAPFFASCMGGLFGANFRATASNPRSLLETYHNQPTLSRGRDSLVLEDRIDTRPAVFPRNRVLMMNHVLLLVRAVHPCTHAIQSFGEPLALVGRKKGVITRRRWGER